MELVSHSSDHHDLSQFKGCDVIVIGAGQSALETAALLNECQAKVRLLVRRPSIIWNPPLNWSHDHCGNNCAGHSQPWEAAFLPGFAQTHRDSAVRSTSPPRYREPRGQGGSCKRTRCRLSHGGSFLLSWLRLTTTVQPDSGPPALPICAKNSLRHPSNRNRSDANRRPNERAGDDRPKFDPPIIAHTHNESELWNCCFS
jgi:hypothetical protein